MHKLPSDDTPLQFSEFTTRDLPGAEQFGAFSAAYQGVFDIFHNGNEKSAFPVSHKVWMLDKLVLVSAQLPGPDCAFGWRHTWHPAPLDHWYVLLPFDGVDPGAIRDQTPSLSFHCLGKPFEARLEARGLLMLFIPRDFVAIDFGPFLDRPFDAGAGLLLADFLASLCRRLPGLRPGELPGVLETTRSLVASCTGARKAAMMSAHDSPDLRLLDRAKRLIERRIAEPDLSPQSLCRDLFVSRSRLYRAFAPLGGISAYIRRQRLIQARSALLSAHDTRPIVRLAEQWGFSSASAFSRAFRYEFGESPQRIRKIGWEANTRPAGQVEPAMQEETSSLHALLRSIRD
jgi:AraC-like DNA-binding protein